MEQLSSGWRNHGGIMEEIMAEVTEEILEKVIPPYGLFKRIELQL